MISKRPTQQDSAAASLMDRLRPGWRERAEAQRSWWKPIEMLLVIAAWLAMLAWIWRYGLWSVHAMVHQHPAQTFAEYQRHGASIFLNLGAIAAGLPLFCLAGVGVNSLVSLVAPLRALSERGSDKLPELTIAHANRELARLGLRLAVVAVPLALLGAAAPF